MKENITKKNFGGVLVILSMMICCIQIFCEGSPENTVQLSLEELWGAYKSSKIFINKTQ